MGSHINPDKPSDRDAGRAALEALRQIVRTLRSSSQAAERHAGISGAQLFVLEELSKRPAESLDELADRILTHQSSVSVVVTHLVEKGLVSRTPSITDARRVCLEITPRGRRLHKKAPVAAQVQLFAAIKRLPVATRRSLAVGLTELVKKMGVARAGSAPLFFEEDHRKRSKKRRKNHVSKK